MKSQQTNLSETATSKMANKESITGKMTCKKGTRKHCCWGLCNLDSRYADWLKEDVFFLQFDKPGQVKDNMTSWQKKPAETEDRKSKMLVTCLW